MTRAMGGAHSTPSAVEREASDQPLVSSRAEDRMIGKRPVCPRFPGITSSENKFRAGVFSASQKAWHGIRSQIRFRLRCVAPPGLSLIRYFHPGFPPWARLCRPAQRGSPKLGPTRQPVVGQFADARRKRSLAPRDWRTGVSVAAEPTTTHTRCRPSPSPCRFLSWSSFPRRCGSVLAA